MKHFGATEMHRPENDILQTQGNVLGGYRPQQKLHHHFYVGEHIAIPTKIVTHIVIAISVKMIAVLLFFCILFSSIFVDFCVYICPVLLDY